MRRVERRGQVVETELSELQAWEELRFLVKKGIVTGDFPESLSRMDFNAMSDAQSDWCAIIVEKHRGQVAPSQPVAVQSAFASIVEMVTRARERQIKWPKIRLREGIRIGVCGSQSRYSGQLKVATDDGRWLGRIDQKGLYYGDPKALPVLDEFARNPHGVSRVYGQRTGNCCFCGLQLTTNESLEAGYGPVCAQNFGLPWGSHDELPEDRLTRLKEEIRQIDEGLER